MGPKKTGIPWRLAAGAVLVALLSFGVACRDRTPIPSENSIEQATPGKRFTFRDVTADSGVDFTYHNGQEASRYSILESLGGGIALLDYDGDGLLDIFLTGGGSFTGPDNKEIAGLPCKLYKNLGGWKFRDVSAEVGLEGIDFYSHGAAVGDYTATVGPISW